MMVFHPLITDLPRPSGLNDPFDYEPDPLSLLAAEQTCRLIEMRPEWTAELRLGKMFGVLVAESTDGRLGFLCAYSGQILGRSDWEGFVPAVFDYLQEDGYFKTEEARITAINHKIAELEDSEEYIAAAKRIAETKAEAEKDIENYRAAMSEAKKKRDQSRQHLQASDDELIRESQFQKAELRRIKKRWGREIALAEESLKACDCECQALGRERHERSDSLQRWLFSKFEMIDIHGKRQNLLRIFRSRNGQIPPAGAGECCAPKLLQYAFEHSLNPLSIAEFWWQPPSSDARKVVCDGEIRHHGSFYPACRSKCLPILTYMLNLKEAGAETKFTNPKIVYEDEDIVAVDKPCGMLSVPGKSPAKSVEDFVRAQCPGYDGPVVVHRLDMDTSGIMLLAKNKPAHQNLQKQFRERTIHKRYIATLEHEFSGAGRGTITLPLIPDICDRPRQMVDFQNGKPAESDYVFIRNTEGHAVVALYPLTGRTHQLRVHCASLSGLGNPILGDRVYGHNVHKTSGCLHLRADKIVFSHPRTGKRMKIMLIP